MLMAHKEYGFYNIPDGMAEQAVIDGWFAVVDMAEAKAILRGDVDIKPEPAAQIEQEAPQKRRGRPKKVN